MCLLETVKIFRNSYTHNNFTQYKTFKIASENSSHSVSFIIFLTLFFMEMVTILKSDLFKTKLWEIQQLSMQISSLSYTSLQYKILKHFQFILIEYFCKISPKTLNKLQTNFYFIFIAHFCRAPVKLLRNTFCC